VGGTKKKEKKSTTQTLKSRGHDRRLYFDLGGAGKRGEKIRQIRRPTGGDDEAHSLSSAHHGKEGKKRVNAERLSRQSKQEEWKCASLWVKKREGRVDATKKRKNNPKKKKKQRGEEGRLVFFIIPMLYDRQTRREKKSE